MESIRVRTWGSSMEGSASKLTGSESKGSSLVPPILFLRARTLSAVGLPCDDTNGDPDPRDGTAPSDVARVSLDCGALGSGDSSTPGGPTPPPPPAPPPRPTAGSMFAAISCSRSAAFSCCSVCTSRRNNRTWVNGWMRGSEAADSDSLRGESGSLCERRQKRSYTTVCKYAVRLCEAWPV